ncbi:MAG: hypothetical protein ACOCWU_05965 [Spirochaetota bacterium]
MARILLALAKRTGHPKVTFDKLLNFTHRYLEKYAEGDPELADLDDNTENVLIAHLLTLESRGRAELSYEGSRISGVYFSEYYPRVITAAYGRLRERTFEPFPSEETIGLTIPNELIHPVDLRTEFVEWLGAEDRSDDTLLRLMFPEDLQSIVATLGIVRNNLASLSLLKLREYLRNRRNATYMHSKLRAAFPNRDVALKEALNKVLTTPDDSLGTIKRPTEFTFHFWTSLSSAVIKELAEKQEMQQEELDYCRAAYLLGYYAVYYKGVEQRKRDIHTALKSVDAQLRKPPYAFTRAEIDAFTDGKGVPLVKRCSREHVDDFLKQKLLPPDDSHMPEIVRVRGADGTDYYVRKDAVFRIVFPEMRETAQTFRTTLTDKWIAALRRNETLREMQDDAAFEQVLTDMLKERKPLLYGLLRFDLLHLIAREQKLLGSAREELDRMLDRKQNRIRPLSTVLDLDRRKLLGDARLRLPFWQAVPILRGLVTFLKRLFLGEPSPRRKRRRTAKQQTRRGKESAAQETQAPHDGGAGEDAAWRSTAVRFGERPRSTTEGSQGRGTSTEVKRAARTLQEEYVPQGSDVDTTLEELAEKWNPLLDPVAQHNLVEDVNSLVRDFLRRRKTMFRTTPPTRSRIQQMSAQLAQNAALAEIKRKEPLRRYLELYMLRILGN